MPTAEGCAGRRRRLWEALPALCDVLLVSDLRHLAYLAGYAPSPFTFRTASGGALLVMFPDRSILVGDNLLGPFLNEAHVDEVVAPTWYDGRSSPLARLNTLVQNVVEVLPKAPARRLGLEGASVPWSIVDRLRSRGGVDVIEVQPTLIEARRTKDADETAAIREVLRAADAGIAAALEFVRPGMSEIDAFRIVEGAASDSLGERIQLYGDFVSGPEMRQRLGPPTARVLEAGELFLMDFSVIHLGYRGDTANTIVVGGKPSETQRRWHDACLAAHEAVESLLKPGVSCRTLDNVMRKALQESGGDPNVDGHFGHGIGLDHPEAPFILAESRDSLREGDVVTLEPGQYGPPLGAMRIERNYRIGKGRPEVLSGHELRLA